MSKTKLAGLVVAGVGALLNAAGGVQAQPFPSKPVRLVVPFAPGGGTDVATRIIAPKLSERIGQPVVVDNRPGAAGAVGAESVAKSAPDGYTMLIGSTSELAIGPNLRARMPYDVQRDFAAVAPFAATPMVLVVTPSLPVKTTMDLVKLARKRPGDINFGSAGAGTGNHMWSVMLAHMTGINIVHVAYKGAGPAQVDVMSGQVQMMFSTLPAATPFVNSGRLKALAVSSAKRVPTLPQVPTVMESGVPGFEAVYWYGFFAPVATPKDVQSRVLSDTAAVLKTPDIVASLSKQGLQTFDLSQAQFAAFVRAEGEKWRKVVKGSGARLD
jgi:tripartite-type tricarboxylate transporter receptor subunit TctC